MNAPRFDRPAKGRRDEGGFTLIEMMIVTILMATIFSTLTLGLRAAHAAAFEMDRRAALTLMADDLMDRLFRIDFGQPTDGAATAAQLTALFDDDDDLGTATLTSLRKFAGSTGYTFFVSNFPYGGLWEVRVTADLNGDGDELDANEGRDDLFRIDIIYNGVRILECLRAAPVG